MGFWFLDDRTQLALLLAGLIGAGGAAGCDDGRPVPLDGGRGDVRPDVMVSDMLPPDASPDVMVSDMLPPDASPDVPIADPLPSDASAATPPRPGQWGAFQIQPPDRQSLPGRGDRLPLNRSLRTVIQALPRAGGIELVARSQAPDPARLTYSWRASGGTLDRSDGPTALWSPPTTPGRHMVQVTVRDQHRTIFVAVHLHTVE